MWRTTLLAAGLLLPLGAQAQTPAAPASGSTVAYPNNPQPTPQSQNGGAPVTTDRTACPAGAPCPSTLPVSAAADSGTTAQPAPGGVRTPASAYPDSPVQTPAANPSGLAPKR